MDGATSVAGTIRRGRARLNPTEVDREVLAAIFASRVSLAKRTEEQVVNDARLEWRKAQAWIASPATREGSFIWFCDEFEHDPGAVRRAIQERRA